MNGCSTRSQAAFVAGYQAAARALAAWQPAAVEDDPAARIAAVEQAALQQHDLSQRVAACRDAIGQAESLPEAERRAVVEAVRQALTDLDACCDRLQSAIAVLLGPPAQAGAAPGEAGPDDEASPDDGPGSPDDPAAPRSGKPASKPRTPRRR